MKVKLLTTQTNAKLTEYFAILALIECMDAVWTVELFQYKEQYPALESKC